MDYSELIKESKCFGIAWDGSVRECKICDIALACKKRTQNGGLEPSEPVEEIVEEVKADKVKDKPEKAKKPKKAKKTVTYSDDMPDMKPMSMDELLDLLVERTGKPKEEFDKFSSEPKIRRMRLIMALKATYKVE